MSVNLQKGQKVDLTKGSSSLNRLIVGLGWDEAKEYGKSIDCDALAVMLSDGGRLTGMDNFVFYNNLRHKSGAVVHMGDNLVGGSSGDDEQIKITLRDVPREIEKIVIIVTIFEAAERSQNFGLIENAYIHITDEDAGNELCRFDLTGDYSGKTAMIFGEIYRSGSEWHFSAIGEGTKDNGIIDIAARYRYGR